MKKYQQDFIDLALAHEVLRFGEFTLKSGRVSPYFFNAGLFDSGRAMTVLARCYAQVIIDSGVEYDVLFGPAYKGIPLVAAVAMVLAEQTEQSVPFAFNRKEQKQHGEGGMMVGASVRDKRILILDDVMTAGTAVRQVIGLLAEENATVAGVVIALDRQEKGLGELSAVQELQQESGIETHSIIGMSTLIDYLSASQLSDGQEAGQKESGEYLTAMHSYRERYGVS